MGFLILIEKRSFSRPRIMWAKKTKVILSRRILLDLTSNEATFSFAMLRGNWEVEKTMDMIM